MKRFFDFLILLFFVPILSLPFLTVAILVKITSKGTIFYWSDRVGKDNVLFKMPKFRSMKLNTPAVATHLLQNPDNALTSIGGFIRKTSLDELPQLWCILKGDMSFVGPRPALFNQDDLIELRKKSGVDKILPGLTGWAQVNGRDELSISVKVQFDKEYLEKQSIYFDIKILWFTFIKVVKHDGVTH